MQLLRDSAKQLLTNWLTLFGNTPTYLVKWRWKIFPSRFLTKVLKIPSQGKKIENEANEYLSTHCKAPYYKHDQMYSKSSQKWLSSKAQYPSKE